MVGLRKGPNMNIIKISFTVLALIHALVLVIGKVYY